jgi:hypothetical protein
MHRAGFSQKAMRDTSPKLIRIPEVCHSTIPARVYWLRSCLGEAYRRVLLELKHEGQGNLCFLARNE